MGLSWEDRKRPSDVGVLIDYVRCEIDSTALPSARATRLIRDVNNIPRRFKELLEADMRTAARAQKRARSRGG